MTLANQKKGLSNRLTFLVILVTVMTYISTSLAAGSLHKFQTKNGAVIYTSTYANKGVRVRSDQLFYRKNTNLNGSILFNANSYGKGSVLLNATLGNSNVVYVLANIIGSKGTESTIFEIDLNTKKVTGKIRLANLGIDNVLPNPFTYEAATNTVKINASRGYSNKNGTVSSKSGFFWIGSIEKGLATIKKSKFD